MKEVYMVVDSESAVLGLFKSLEEAMQRYQAVTIELGDDWEWKLTYEDNENEVYEYCGKNIKNDDESWICISLEEIQE